MSKGHLNKTLLFLFICVPFFSFSQDDDGLKLLKDADDIQIKFENHYFEALKYKAIGNYSRAITELEKCQQLVSDDESIDFEFSKNYFHLTKYTEAQLYIEKSLTVSPENYWYLEQAKKVYLKQFHYPKAIEVQKKQILQKPHVEEDLVLLYIQANEREKAKLLINDIESRGVSSSRLKHFKDVISKSEIVEQPKVEENESISDNLETLKSSFENNKEYKTLSQILNKELAAQNFESLLKYSSEGLELFPAQPLVYLMHGKALMHNQKYSEATNVLKDGLDFIFDESQLEIDFYEQLSKCHQELGNEQKTQEYLQKMNKLKTPSN